MANGFAAAGGDWFTLFPSPCGVNIVANLQHKGLYQAGLNVSVPLRGKYRGESLAAKMVTVFSTQSFRPLAG